LRHVWELAAVAKANFAGEPPSKIDWDTALGCKPVSANRILVQGTEANPTRVESSVNPLPTIVRISTSQTARVLGSLTIDLPDSGVPGVVRIPLRLRVTGAEPR
jgi:hypothetical protein